MAQMVFETVSRFGISCEVGMNSGGRLAPSASRIRASYESSAINRLESISWISLAVREVFGIFLFGDLDEIIAFPAERGRRAVSDC